jgi:hypothetical protein
VLKVSQEQLELKDFKAPKVQQEQQAPKVSQEQLAPKVSQAPKDFKEKLELLELKDFKEKLELLAQ